MIKNLTEIVFIIDKSGSMSGLELDTIGGFNSMLRKQREEEGEAYVSTVLFDTSQTVLHDRVPLDRIEDMTRNQYREQSLSSRPTVMRIPAGAIPMRISAGLSSARKRSITGSSFSWAPTSTPSP